MSPEQLMGRHLDGRSDQYSLAVVALRLLTGGQQMVAGYVNRLLGTRVDAVLNRAMAMTPEERYPLCTDFAQELSEALAASQSSQDAATAYTAPPSPSATQPQAPPAEPRPPGSGKTWIIGGAVGAFLLAVGLYFVLSPRAHQQTESPAAQETWLMIKDSRNAGDFETFAKAFPQSEYARAAEVRAAQLRREEPAKTPSPGVKQYAPEQTSAAAEAWAAIRDSQKAEDFDAFIKAFPRSEFARVAALRADRLKRTAETAKSSPAPKQEAPKQEAQKPEVLPESPKQGAKNITNAAEETWAMIKGSENAEDFDNFIKAFPSSELAKGAEIRAKQLRAVARAVAAPEPPKPGAELPKTTAEPPKPAASTGPRAGDVKVNSKDGLKYVSIPAGTFVMGCSPGDGECNGDEKPAHQVTLSKGFWIGQTEVTQEAYQRVARANPRKFKGLQLPVEQVSWNESKSYCSAVNLRLPTEAEWEYAARGGNTGARYGELGAIAWYDQNSGGKTHEVGQKPANGYGLYDMLGNVGEWVNDWYGAYGADSLTDPRGVPEGQYKALRGGSWSSFSLRERVSSRYGFGPGNRYNNIGFRCAGDSL
jgi:formylglycine-generating enzyme required for sulfatase activity